MVMTSVMCEIVHLYGDRAATVRRCKIVWMPTPPTTPPTIPTVTPDQFFAADLRVGRVVNAEPFPEARKPAIKLLIDFGELGTRRSSAQLTMHYQPADLVGRLVVAVVNFPPRQIGPFISEVLVLGACESPSNVVLLGPDSEVPLGTRIA